MDALSQMRDVNDVANQRGVSIEKYLTVKLKEMEKIKIKKFRSIIRIPYNQKATIKALGLRKINQVVEKDATPQILGMIKKVSHLVEVVD